MMESHASSGSHCNCDIMQRVCVAHALSNAHALRSKSHSVAQHTSFDTYLGTKGFQQVLLKVVNGVCMRVLFFVCMVG